MYVHFGPPNDVILKKLGAQDMMNVLHLLWRKIDKQFKQYVLSVGGMYFLTDYTP